MINFLIKLNENNVDLIVTKCSSTYRQYLMNRMKILHENSSYADNFIYSILYL